MLTVIKVTPEIILKSRPRCSTNCLIANAIDEVLEPCFSASVGSSVFSIRNAEDGQILTGLLPLSGKAKSVISWYDKKHAYSDPDVELFNSAFGTDSLEIEINIPEQYLKKLPFNPEATCSPTATQCPRCNNPWNVCDNLQKN